MKKIYAIVILPLATLILLAAIPVAKKPAVLIFSKTNGYHHACIPAGIAAIQKLGAENGFSVDSTTDSLSFTKTNLKKYSAVIFLCPTGKVFGPGTGKKHFNIIFNREAVM